MLQALQRVPILPEWQNKTFLKRYKFPGYRDALCAIHMPDTPIACSNPARRRLAYDELLAEQLALALVRLRMRRLIGCSLPSCGTYLNCLRQHLPFQLTESQERVFAEISQDLAANACCAYFKAMLAQEKQLLLCLPWHRHQNPVGHLH